MIKKPMAIKLFFGTIVLVIAVAYIVTGIYLYLNQRKMLYFPQPGVLNTTEQTIEIHNGNITLRGWVANEHNNNAIIYFGGNAERPEVSINDFKQLFSNQTIYFINYRGYGESDGTPTETNLYADALAIYDHIAPQHNHITVIGRSLGTGVATYLATQRNIHKLILVTPFDCLANIGQSIYPVFPVKLIMKDRYNSADRAKDITAQTLIVIAEQDQVIPRNSTDKLIEEFNPGILEVTVIQEATHNNIQNYTQYYLRLRGFVNGE